MRHLLLILAAAVLAYVAWQFMSRRERVIATKLIARHGLRLGAIFLVIFGFLAIAYHLPSSNLL